MEDSKIIELFYARSEDAIAELSKKYGPYCQKIAKNILNNAEDAEECVNDAYLAVWNTVPPQKPDPLLTYLCHIVRNLAIMKYHGKTAKKRNSIYDVALEEIGDCLPSSRSVEDEAEANAVAELIDRFLGTLEKRDRIMFVRRYWHSDTISEIAALFKMSNNHVSVRLSRIRKELKKYLAKEGVSV